MKSEASRRDLAAAHKANIDAFHAFGTETIVRAERLLALNLDFARRFTGKSLARAAEALGTRRERDASAVLPEAVKPELDRTLDYARQVGEILAEGQREYLGIGKRWLTEANHALERLLSDAGKTAPAGSESMFAAMQSAIELTNDLYERMGRQVGEAAEGVSGAIVDTGTGAQTQPARRGAASKSAAAADEPN